MACAGVFAKVAQAPQSVALRTQSRPARHTRTHTLSFESARVCVPIGLLSERGSTSSAWDDAYALFGRLRSGMDTHSRVSDEWGHGGGVRVGV